MSSKQMTLIVLAAALVGLAYLGWKLTARGAYESPEYSVLESEGPFEIREYPSVMLATTSMQLAAEGDDGSFMRLFRYIGGANDEQQKVAMTTPVFMRAENDEQAGQMGFVIPKQIAEERIPEPSANDVEIRERSGGRFAVIQFRGRLNSSSAAEAERRLRDWMRGRGIRGESGVESAGYDPPWTPGPLRRNEVLIRLQ